MDETVSRAYLNRLRDYWTGEPDVADIDALNAELYGATDRAAAVVLGSLSERSLAALLRNAMPHADREVFEFNGPCGSFSAKIMMARALGLIGPKTRHDLDLIRNVRNAFAHSRRPIQFSDKAVADVCKHLNFPDFPNTRIPFMSLETAPREMLKDAADRSHPRTRYGMAITEIAVRSYYIRGGKGDEDLNELP